MKKLVCLALVFVMTIGIAMADTIDLSGMSKSELVELRNQIDAVLREKHDFFGDPIPTGDYKAGVVIKPGTYDIAITDSDTVAMVIVNDADGNEVFYTYTEPGYVVRVQLEDGYTLRMYECQGLIKAVPKYDWMI